MNSQKVYNARGFTLVEVLVVVALVSMVIAGGVAVSLSGISRASIASERAQLVSLLTTTRSRALANIHALPQGIRINENTYVLFEGSSWSASSNETHVSIDRSSSVTVSGAAEVVFIPLSADVVQGDVVLTMSQGSMSHTISVLRSGQIEW